jgi:hypothetical protein
MTSHKNVVGMAHAMASSDYHEPNPLSDDDNIKKNWKVKLKLKLQT